VQTTKHLCVRPRVCSRRLALVAASLGVVTTASCDDPFALKAESQVVTDTMVVYAMSGTPLGFPSALSTTFRTVVRVDPSFAFDVAFDIDAQSRVRLIPVRLVGGSATQTRQVGLQKLTVPFDQLLLAPGSGYTYDSVLVLGPGESAVIQALSERCALFVNQFLYSKLAIDSVFTASRLIRFHLVHDPNCGFRSFAPGVPKS